MKLSFRQSLAMSALACAALVAGSAEAKTFKWANSGDVSSMDPYGRNETFLLSFLGNVYEPLFRRNEALKLEPALAVSASQPAPGTGCSSARRSITRRGSRSRSPC